MNNAGVSGRDTPYEWRIVALLALVGVDRFMIMPPFEPGIAPIGVTQLMRVVSWHWIFATGAVAGLVVCMPTWKVRRDTSAELTAAHTDTVDAVRHRWFDGCTPQRTAVLRSEHFGIQYIMQLGMTALTIGLGAAFLLKETAPCGIRTVVSASVGLGSRL